MTTEAFLALLARHELSKVDAALICGVTTRAVEKWITGEHAIPRTASLILMAIDEKIITLEWVARRVRSA